MIFGIKPSTILIRKAKYTIGYGINSLWNDKIHSGKGKKYLNEEENRWYCPHCFAKFIKINQNLRYEEEISRSCFLKTKNQKILTLEFYKTKKVNPIFVFEEGVIKIGEYTLDLGRGYENKEDREVETIMKFGGTFIDVTSIHLKSRKSVKTTLKFD